MKLGFFEKALIARSELHPEFVGRVAVVLGISEEDGIVHGYAATLLGEAVQSFAFAPDELIGTGEFVDRSDVYDDADRLSVSVTDDGEGSIKEPQ